MRDERARRRIGGRDIGGEDLDPFARDFDERAGGGIEGADLAFGLNGGGGGIEAGFGLDDLCRVSDAVSGCSTAG